MLFNSPSFFALLAAVLVATRLAPSHRVRLGVLLGASWFFYLAWYPVYLLQFLAVTGVTYLLGRRVAGEGGGRWLRLGVAANLLNLFLFKYLDFALGSAQTLAGWCGYPGVTLPRYGLFLPLGISFYSFQMIAYLVDVARGRFPPVTSFRRFSLFISFFPQLIAGPIVRGQELLPQLEEDRVATDEQLGEGLDLVALGLLKKVVVADQISPFVDEVFGAPAGLGRVATWLAFYAYSIQIYCDFSGYTDIGRGAALLLGYRLPENFASPYFSGNIVVFWRRWHMTLSQWLRDYLYITLGGNRHGAWMTYRNLFLTMLLGGLWHGASWNFVVWGALHGVALAAVRFAHTRAGVGQAEPLVGGSAYRVLATLVTYHFVCFAWVFFRAPDFAGAAAVLREMALGATLPPLARTQFGLVRLGLVGLGVAAAMAAHALAYFAGGRLAAAADRRLPGWRAPLFAALALVVIVCASASAGSFIYFQF